MTNKLFQYDNFDIFGHSQESAYLPNSRSACYKVCRVPVYGILQTMLNPRIRHPDDKWMNMPDPRFRHGYHHAES